MERHSMLRNARIVLWARSAPFLGEAMERLAETDVPFLVLPDTGEGIPRDIPGSLDDVEVLVVGGAWVRADSIDRFPKLKLIVRAGVGLDRIDLAHAQQRGVQVTAVDDYGINEVADHTVLLMLATIRRCAVFQAQARWPWSKVRYPSVPRLQGLRVGLVGVGRIGSAVAQRVRAFGMSVQGHDPLRGPEHFEARQIPAVGWSELLSTSDVISLHLPLSAQTQHLLNAEAFTHTARKPYVINTARGGLIDTAALAAALADGRLRGAGLDVLENEPDVDQSSPLWERPDVLITPHSAWYSEGSRRQMGRTAIDRATDFLDASTSSPDADQRLESQ